MAGFGVESTVTGGVATTTRFKVDFTTPAQAWDGSAARAGVVTLYGVNASATDYVTIPHFGSGTLYGRPFLVVKVVK